ncbi:MAG: hypothetical protein EZS26_001033 [Candidatus Ordinivivax streblomastigis]|uniref:Uncharacterized protein n=1 Tax=Candidatus Ordinivivax streblomastigis TaxID=2540710 RepID=A0A5M8P332_9BACT|nr:MAG: hypothetical protein EZS26_001033 [Candidatus Ordinivivax streblomastigis]
MAKKITNDEGQNTVNEVNTTVNDILPEGTNTGSEEIVKPETASQPAPESKPDKGEKESKDTKQAKVETRDYPPFIDTILKSFLQYETLYIDAHGGAFTPSTSQKIRGNATLYKNPYHNKN